METLISVLLTVLYSIGIWTKCHNADGEIRIQQKFYRDVTKVLQGCNMV